eukprot:comp9709_c1_seq1/m.4686 comp9709_c1_seq1/g.4686  ORF comp9709_c1_seq1/g.4686 comp9709_c1_seq1/m.4686 type:complete len:219 (-) comp9709_c1_seq1:298-954(-)
MPHARTMFTLRHGERADLAQPGWEETAPRPWDPPLTETGKEQARKTGAFLSGQGITHIFCSPFTRCLETAAGVASVLNVPIVVEEGLTEFLAPNWFRGQPDYLALGDMRKLAPTLDSNYTSIVKPRYPESPDQMIERYLHVGRQLMEIGCDGTEVAGLPVGNILLVTHGYAIQFVSHVFEPDTILVEAPYCCLSKFVRDDSGKTVVELLASADHWQTT